MILTVPSFHRFQRGAGDLGGVHEPLVGQHRLDHDLGAVAEGLHDRFVFDEGNPSQRGVNPPLPTSSPSSRRLRSSVGHHRQTLGGDVGDDPFARLKPVEAAIGRRGPG